MANCSQCGRQVPGFGFGKPICRWCRMHEAAKAGQDVEVQPVMTAPWLRSTGSGRLFTQGIFGLNVAVFLGMAFAGVSLSDPTPAQLVQWGANWGPLTFGGQLWRLITYNFVHIGLIHIAFNMWCLWDLGALCENLYGRFSFIAIYLISGVAGGVASKAWHPLGVSAGASGAIFGLAGALIASFYLGEFSLPRMAIQGTLRSVVFFAGYNLVFGAISGATDNACHVGGLLAGLAMGALIARVAPDGSAVGRRIMVLLLVFVAVAGGAVWLQYTLGHRFRLQENSQIRESSVSLAN